MNIAVYPGSFDPITCGHLDILKRCSQIYDKVIIAVLNNSSKTPLFTADERVKLINKAAKDLKNCIAMRFDGLLVDFVRQQNANVVIKGLRAISDFEYEFQMALLNKKLCPNVETLFMVTNVNYSYISSSIVKEIAVLGGDFSELVPPEITDDIKQKILRGKNNGIS